MHFSNKIVNDYTDIERFWIEYGKSHNNNDFLRLADLTKELRLSSKRSALSTLAANCIVPLYIPYILHVIKDALSREIESIYFLARDGYILKEIAEEFKTLLRGEIEFKYLYVSRKSLRLPYLWKANSEDYLCLFPKRTLIGQYVNHLLSDFPIREQEKSEHCPFSFQQIQTPLEEKVFLDTIFSSPFYDKWQQRCQQSYLELLEYFKKEHFLDHGKIAIVDVGWLGTTRIMINKIRKDYDHQLPSIFSYYWGARQDVLSSSPDGLDVYNKRYDGGGRLYAFIEDYCSACPHSTTISYYNGEPVLKDSLVSDRNKILVHTNVVISSMAAKIINERNVSQASLDSWMNITYDSLCQFKFKLDYSPLLGFPELDGSLVKKLTIKDIYTIIKGKKVSKMDIASLDYTLGFSIRKIIFYIMEFFKSFK